ncbi:MAG: hypothetical protein K1X75_11510 [Leptospirales bacterium]|nr:hypothetical protein [Leptospirales bacterium]
MDVDGILRTHYCHRGHNIAELTHELPLLFVFLRQLGCIFCRESLIDLGKQRQAIELEGSAIVLVHMSSPEEAAEVFERYGLRDVIHLSDPGQKIYRAFQLQRGWGRRMLGWKVWTRALALRLLGGVRQGPVMGDVTQMPGIFLVYRGQVVSAHRNSSAAERPDYVEMARYPFETRSAANLAGLGEPPL